MKNTCLLFFAILLFSCIGCTSSSKQYHIVGTLPSTDYDGEWMYLVPVENREGGIDSVKIKDAAFEFTGEGEEMRILRLRPVLRIRIQELLLVTEPGEISVKADSIGSVTGTPQNDALQAWKDDLDKKRNIYVFAYDGFKSSKTREDSLKFLRIRDSLMQVDAERNFMFLKEQGNNTLGTFMQKSLRSSLNEQQKKELDASLK